MQGRISPRDCARPSCDCSVVRRSAVSPKRCQGARPAVHAAGYFRSTPMRIVARLASLILLPILALPLRAQDVQVGTALVCDTRQQVERFVALYDGDFDAA